MLLPKGLRSTTFFLENRSILYLFLMAIACLLLSYASLWLINYDNNKQQQRFINYHGTIVNQLMVKQLATAMANNDLIAMQSFLQRLSQQQKVVNTVIYDLNNRVVVQSGTINPRPLASHHAFTTPIVLEDSYLGSLTTTLNIDFYTKGWLFLAVIIGTALPFLLLARLIARESGTNTTKLIAHTKVDNIKTDIETKPELSEGFLLIQIHTLDKVYKQLNAQARDKEFKTLDILLKHILTLYSGEKIALSQQMILLKFSQEDTNKLLFDAIYSAYLLLELAKKKCLFIKLSAILYSEPQHISLPEQMPQLAQLHQPDSILVNSLLERDILEDKILFEKDEESSFQKVMGFSQSHQALLSNQLSQLLKMR